MPYIVGKVGQDQPVYPLSLLPGLSSSAIDLSSELADDQ